MDAVEKYITMVKDRHLAGLKGENSPYTIDDLDALYQELTDDDVVRLDQEWKKFLSELPPLTLIENA